MKKVTVVYRIISYILVVFAGLLGLADVIMLIGSLLNPAGLLSVVIVAAVVVYSFTSFYFSLRAIQYNRACKPRLHTWIRVTGIITVIFALWNLVVTVKLMVSPDIMNDYYKEMIKAQPSLGKSGVSKEELMQLIRVVLYVCEAYFLLLLLHVTITFGLVKQYAHLFRKDDNGPQQQGDLL